MRFLTVLYFFVTCYSTYAQVDTIYTSSEKIPCTIKEVTPDAVQFTYTGENVPNTLYKTNINKIVFRSGRIQSFSESMTLSPITKIADYSKVVITQLEGEVKGLHKIGEVSSSSQGGSVYSNIDRVKERALNKLKMEAVMRGANLVYMSYQQTSGNQYGGYFQASRVAETIYTGIAYTNVLPNKANFIAKLNNADLLVSVKQIELQKGSALSKAEYKIYANNQDIAIKQVVDEGGLLYVEAVIKGFTNKSFRLVRFNDESFTLLAEDKNRLVNYIIPFKGVLPSQVGSSNN